MNISEIEQALAENSELKNMFVEPPCDELMEVWKLNKGKLATLKSIVALNLIKSKKSLDLDCVPEEVKLFVDKCKIIFEQIQLTLLCENFFHMQKQKQIILNIINNPLLDVSKYFPAVNKEKFLSYMLIYAVSKDNNDLINLALSLGASINSEDKYGLTTLMWYCENGNENVARILIEKGADINKAEKQFQETALMIAAKNNNEGIVKILLNNGALINLQSYRGWTALMEAVSVGNIEIVKLLLEFKADLNATDSNGGDTALTLAQHCNYHKIVKLLSKASKA